MSQTNTVSVIEAGSTPVRTVLKLSWPSIIEQIMLTMVQYVDTAMVGSLGAVATAAIAVNSSPIWLMNGIMAAIGIGFTVPIARCIGARDTTGAKHVTRQAVIITFLVGLLVTLVCQLIAPMLPYWMGAEAEVVPYAIDYMRIVSSTFLLHTGSQVFSSIIRGAGDTRTPMFLNIMTNVINIILNFLFIFETKTYHIFGMDVTLWGAGLGVRGAAIATAISTGFVGLMITLTLFMRKKSPIHISVKEDYRPDKVILKDMVRVGLPTALERFTISLGQIVFTMLVAGVGTVSLAAHHLAITAESLSYTPAFGFSIAATTLVGQSLGAKRPDLAHKFSNITMRFGVALMTLAGVCLFLFPEFLMGIFTSDPAVIEKGSEVLKIVAFSEPFFALSIMIFGSLRGAGDTKWPFYISAICMWGVRLSTAWLFAYPMGLGLKGIWYGMICDIILRGIMAYIRLRKLPWEQLADR